MFNFEDLKIIYNRKKVSIKDLINIYGFKYYHNRQHPECSLNDFLLSSNNIKLTTKNETIEIIFYSYELSIYEVNYIHKLENNHIKRICYHENGNIKSIHTLKQKICYYENGNIESIEKNSIYPKYQWSTRNFFYNNKIKSEIITTHRAQDLEIKYYINGVIAEKKYINRIQQLHNIDGPALIKYDINGKCYQKDYYVFDEKLQMIDELDRIKKIIENVDINAVSHVFKRELIKLELNVQYLYDNNIINEDMHYNLLEIINSYRVIKKIANNP